MRKIMPTLKNIITRAHTTDWDYTKKEISQQVYETKKQAIQKELQELINKASFQEKLGWIQGGKNKGIGLALNKWLQKAAAHETSDCIFCTLKTLMQEVIKVNPSEFVKFANENFAPIVDRALNILQNRDNIEEIKKSLIEKLGEMVHETARQSIFVEIDLFKQYDLHYKYPAADYTDPSYYEGSKTQQPTATESRKPVESSYSDNYEPEVELAGDDEAVNY